MRYYHIWFRTKHKRFFLIDAIDQRIHELFQQIAKDKNIKLLASGSLPDHAHLLVGIEDQQALAWVVHMFKGISTRKVFQEFKMLKQDLITNNFWARKYGAKEVPEENLEAVANYVQNQKKDLHII